MLSHNLSIRVIAPARSLACLSETNCKLAEKRLTDMGFKVSFGKNAFEKDMFSSSSIQSRVADIHDAFFDPNIDIIMAAFGGMNSNEILPFLDYDLIKQNKKIFCGFSDITAVQNALLAKADLVNFYGPCFSHFAMQKGFDYIQKSFLDIILNNVKTVVIEDSNEWSDDKWHKDQENREFIPNPGRWIINTGVASGRIVGGNISTLPLLFGTGFMPSLKDTVLFLEDDVPDLDAVARNLVALSQQQDFLLVRGIVFGRFRKDTDITRENFTYFLHNTLGVKDIPVIANMDFGHTMPYFTIPLGGHAELDATNNKLTVSL